jgi:hypothetical protein
MAQATMRQTRAFFPNCFPSIEQRFLTIPSAADEASAASFRQLRPVHRTNDSVLLRFSHGSIATAARERLFSIFSDNEHQCPWTEVRRSLGCLSYTGTVSPVSETRFRIGPIDR